ncbi:GntR family transcriptional regulator [Defluviimonas sp. WL0024]|uniref:GntR family transcriptional regulator n=2 Tax=Albidovulum TaxID=205889 RepID=A0ABT3JA95_9RHOB|nr:MULTISPECIES: GntR family transcriptional regulator [Defluviimonas]MCU9850256.1 GntR family transcriptional regulator [Defluviimonas sp. WL0024]MCW3784624.1 GntR family transcriptional regulator [Defluviimonas salinarum]
MTKADIAAERLETAIINCELPPGAVFQEAELCELLDLGRTPVREALLRLSGENLVSISRAGVQIPGIDAVAMLKLLELREPIERLTIEKAVQRMTDDDLRLFSDIRTRIVAIADDDRDSFMAILREIHRAIAGASKNEFVSATLRTTQGLSRRFWRYYLTEKDQRAAKRIYCDLLKAIIARDEQDALCQAATLMNHLRDFANGRIDKYQRFP